MLNSDELVREHEAPGHNAPALFVFQDDAGWHGGAGVARDARVPSGPCPPRGPCPWGPIRDDEAAGDGDGG